MRIFSNPISVFFSNTKTPKNSLTEALIKHSSFPSTGTQQNNKQMLSASKSTFRDSKQLHDIRNFLNNFDDCFRQKLF